MLKRDMEKEAAIFEKVKHAREYFKQVIAEFDQTHSLAAQLKKAA